MGFGGLSRSAKTGLVGDLIVKYVGDRYLNKRTTALAPGLATIDIGVGCRVGRYDLCLEGRNFGNARDAISETELGDAQYCRAPARCSAMMLRGRLAAKNS